MINSSDRNALTSQGEVMACKPSAFASPLLAPLAMADNVGLTAGHVSPRDSSRNHCRIHDDRGDPLRLPLC